MAIGGASFANLLTKVPEAIWTGILGAVIALAGVVITNRSAAKRLGLQLVHDAAENAAERKSVMRREVYLRTAEELIRANSHIASLPQLDPGKINLSDGLQGFFIAAAKAQLISDAGTSKLIGQLVSTLGETMLKVMTKSMPIHDLQLEISLKSESIQSANVEIDRVLAAIKKQLDDPDRNSATLVDLEASLGRALSSRLQDIEERDKIWRRRNQLHRAFVADLIVEAKNVSRSQLPVMMAVRRELGLDGDLSEFENGMEQQWERLDVALNNTLQALELHDQIDPD